MMKNAGSRLEFTGLEDGFQRRGLGVFICVCMCVDSQKANAKKRERARTRNRRHCTRGTTCDFTP